MWLESFINFILSWGQKYKCPFNNCPVSCNFSAFSGFLDPALMWVFFFFIQCFSLLTPSCCGRVERFPASAEVPWRSERGGSRASRRPRRYLSPHAKETRKTSERFRTQPVTSSEWQESDRWGRWTNWSCIINKECCTKTWSVLLLNGVLSDKELL